MDETLVVVTLGWALVVLLTLSACVAAGRADRRAETLAADAAARQAVRERLLPERTDESPRPGSPAHPSAPIAIQ